MSRMRIKKLVQKIQKKSAVHSQAEEVSLPGTPLDQYDDPEFSERLNERLKTKTTEMKMDKQNTRLMELFENKMTDMRTKYEAQTELSSSMNESEFREVTGKAQPARYERDIPIHLSRIMKNDDKH